MFVIWVSDIMFYAWYNLKFSYALVSWHVYFCYFEVYFICRRYTSMLQWRCCALRAMAPGALFAIVHCMQLTTMVHFIAYIPSFQTNCSWCCQIESEGRKKEKEKETVIHLLYINFCCYKLSPHPDSCGKAKARKQNMHLGHTLMTWV